MTSQDQVRIQEFTEERLLATREGAVPQNLLLNNFGNFIQLTRTCSIVVTPFGSSSTHIIEKGISQKKDVQNGSLPRLISDVRRH